jgi:hypothetical protein
MHFLERTRFLLALIRRGSLGPFRLRLYRSSHINEAALLGFF